MFKVQFYNKNLIFTTNNRVIASVLTFICRTNNITDNDKEFHCQSSLFKYEL